MIGMFQFLFFIREKQPTLTELRVLAIQCEQLLVIATLNDLTSIQNKDLVALFD